MKALKFLGVAVLACSMLFVSCKKDQNYTITVKADPVEGGTVTGGGSYAANATATLTATANAGYKFTGWSDGTTNNPRTITVTKSETYTAKFQAKASNVISVTFGESAAWTPEPSDYNYSVYFPYSGTDFCLYEQYKTEADYYPSTNGQFVLSASGSQNYAKFDYYKEGGYILTSQSGTDTTYVGDYTWLGSSYNDPYTVSSFAFDATSLKASFNLNIPMIDVAKYFGEQTTVVTNVVVDYYDVTLTTSSAKSAVNINNNSSKYTKCVKNKNAKRK